ncbi:MAG: hypothetical protein IPP90_11610 [Gemmatimonadaceae bacterium]|nr:hypothetical protein [Gemmatimonadaceae bacterium]
MSDRNWEAEMAKIDKQLASVSDEQLLADRKALQAPPGAAGRAPAGKAAAPAAPSRAASPAEGGTWLAWLKVSLAVAAAAGLMYWPWPARCGLPLVGFTAATGGVALLGVWSAVGSWRHRLGLAHVASLLVTIWGVALGAREVLPRVGYAIASVERPGQWSCEGLPAAPTPNAPIAPTTSPPVR